MCRSSRILSFLLMVAAGPALAQSGAVRGARPGVALVGAPSAAVRSGVSTGIQPNRGVMPNVLPGVRPGIYRSIAPNNGVLPGARSGLGRAGLMVGARHGRGFDRIRGRGGYGSYGIDAAGLGLGLAGDLSVPPYGDAGFGGGDPDFVPAYAPPRCIEPLIISIGRGLRHKAHTRIVYGQRRACVP